MRITLYYAHSIRHLRAMARLNISLPDDVYALTRKWRSNMNLSEICARSLREELEAAEMHRATPAFLRAIQPRSETEAELVQRYSLVDAIVCDASGGPDPREGIGASAALYLDRHLCDGALLAICGGRQTWCVVRNMSPRQLRLTIFALGIGQNDPRILHAHPNTLTTLLWLLYSPRSDANLVGVSSLASTWSPGTAVTNHPQYFAVASCGPFSPESPLADLLSQNLLRFLKDHGAQGDFAYHFFDDQGRVLDTPSVEGSSILSPSLLRHLSSRSDARIILAAAGDEKAQIVRFTLDNRLCNVLITDSTIARHLLA